MTYAYENEVSLGIILRKRFRQLRYIKRIRQVIRYFTCKIRSMEISVTHACNYTCPGCYAGKLMEEPAKLTIGQIKKFVDECKPFHVNITGGEPLLRDDIVEIVDSIPKSVIVSIVTNGSLLTEEKLMKLKKAGLNTVQLSYGKNYKNNLKVVQSPVGKSLNIDLSVTNTVTNKPFILEAIEHAKENNWNVLYNLPYGHLEEDFDRDTYFEHRHEPHVREDNMFWKKYNGCPAGTRKIYVTATGQLTPCDRIHEAYDDLDTMKSDYKENKVWCTRLGDIDKKDWNIGDIGKAEGAYGKKVSKWQLTGLNVKSRSGSKDEFKPTGDVLNPRVSPVKKESQLVQLEVDNSKKGSQLVQLNVNASKKIDDSKMIRNCH
jgi:organic radical activating enzyme